MNDLKRLADAPRIAAAPHALAFWCTPGRTTLGKPRIPVLRLHMVGDYQIPPSLAEDYEAEVRANGHAHLFRAAYVQATGHVNFSAAKSAAAVEVVLRRLDSGDWMDPHPRP